MNKEMIKEKIKFVKDKIKDTKKAAIAILVVLVLAITGITAAVVSTNDKPVKRKVENVKRSIKDVDNEEVEQVTETPENTGNDTVATPNEKPSRKTFTEKEKNTENKVEKKSEKSSNTPSSSNASKPSAKTKVWVVDKAAWTETVTKYRTETQTYTVYRNQKGMEFSTYDAAYALYASQPAGTGYAFGPVNKTRTVTVPYYEYINHPEQGHYEYR